MLETENQHHSLNWLDFVVIEAARAKDVVLVDQGASGSVKCWYCGNKMKLIRQTNLFDYYGCDEHESYIAYEGRKKKVRGSLMGINKKDIDLLPEIT